MRQSMRRALFGTAGLISVAGAAFGQDSVANTPGGNDALSAYDTSTLRTRYVVDGVSLTSSWGQSWWIAPVAKASRDLDPMFRTQILGSSAASYGFTLSPTFASTDFALWTARGAGVHPSANTPAAVVSRTGFTEQFAIAATDFSLSPTNIASTIIGRDAENFARLYVTRTGVASSRASSAAAETATLSLGSVTPSGQVFFRADNFTTVPATTNRITGDNILSFNSATATVSSVNTLFLNAGVNTAGNAATSYIVRADAAPYNTPSSVWFPSGNSYALIFDVRAFYRAGSSTANISAVSSAHRPAGIVGHRGNPSFAPITPLGGTAGTVAGLAKSSAGGTAAPISNLAAFGVNSTGAGVPTIASGTPRTFALPAPITVPGYTANAASNASFKQYLSQETFRGGNGHVGIGSTATGQLVLAAVASDPTADDFVAVVTATSPSTADWTIAGYPGMPVLNGPGGTQIGTIQTTNASFSAPAVDLLGNVYFVASWKPSLTPVTTGLFKAVRTGTGYELEKLLSVGDAFNGANSASTYTVSSITLNDADSLASGAFHSSSLLQQQSPSATTSDPTLAKAVGGMIVNATLTYNNNGTNEIYDSVLLLTPQIAIEPAPCPGDFDGNLAVTADDIFAFLDIWFANNGLTCP